LLVKGLHHIGVPVQNMDRAEAFYVGILGLTPCEQKPNWLFAGDHFSVHLMPSRPDLKQVNPARHFTLEVARLEEIASLLLPNDLVDHLGFYGGTSLPETFVPGGKLTLR
jgi:catechol 2,3-dioxygenase-like lactoylglutathione lyase family enzyme